MIKNWLLSLVGNRIEDALAKYKIDPAKLVAVATGLALAYNYAAPAFGKPQIPAAEMAAASALGVWLIAHKKS